ncbi:TadE/TadG family type IV pilus assembly protein [Sphingomicrobium arenosum]|uniref:TadE/TadG family type IV pilus assembly protein n=1 Tax=Sphingomicrobium arenosum TaxID=2233861 RepID=UPI0022410244|nr:TadE/TadG family type IV pilus assembly protein [Sphingomicrobium arenosum]
MIRALASTSRRLRRDDKGAAAAELALAIPMLLVLLLGAVELGNYFVSGHAVQKGVRDASRYAARIRYDDLSSSSCTFNSGTAFETAIKNVARTGSVDGTAEPRLNFWSDNSTLTVTLECDDTGTYAGVFSGFPDGAPRVRVNASVPYQSLFGLPFLPKLLSVNADNQAAVFGA